MRAELHQIVHQRVREDFGNAPKTLSDKAGDGIRTHDVQLGRHFQAGATGADLERENEGKSFEAGEVGGAGGAHVEPSVSHRGASSSSIDARPGAKGPRKGFGPTYIINALTGCWEWQRALDDDGYGYFKAGGKVVRAHRYYYELHVGLIPEGTEPDHTCRNRACVNPAHLEAVPHLTNVRRSAVCKLTMDQAREIRAMKGKAQYADIAAQYGVSESLIAHVMTGRVWRDESHDTQDNPLKRGAAAVYRSAPKDRVNQRQMPGQSDCVTGRRRPSPSAPPGARPAPREVRRSAAARDGRGG